MKRLYLLQRAVVPYRLPLFDELQKVHFRARTTKDRKWSTSLLGSTFKRTVLPGFMLGPFFLNPRLPRFMDKVDPDVVMIGECPEMAFASISMGIWSKIRKVPFVM